MRVGFCTTVAAVLVAACGGRSRAPAQDIPIDDAGATGRGWLPSNGAPVGELNSIVVDPEVPNAVYVGGHGVYRTHDSGAHWTALDVPVAMEDVQDLTFAPSRPSTMYVGGAEKGIWRSVDRGATWSYFESSFKVHALAVDPTNPDVVYAGTWEGNEVGGILPGGLRKSEDGGKTFTPPVALMGSAYRIAVDPEDARSLYVGTSAFLYKSTDGGAHVAPTSGPQYTKAIAFDPLDHRMVYASANKGFARTDDAGATWTSFTLSQEQVVQAIAVHPTTKGVVYFGTCCSHLAAEVFRSDDGGATVRAVSTPEVNVDGVASIAIDPRDPNVVYAANRGVVGTRDGGTSWAHVGKGMTDLYLTDIAIDPVTPSTVYADTYLQGLLKSVDDGQTWTPIATAAVGDGLVIDPATPTRIYAFLPGLQRSDDGGLTFANADVGIVDGLGMRPTVLGVAIMPRTPTTLYAATAAGVFRSTDGAVTWQPRSQGLPPGKTGPIAAAYDESATLYVATSAGLFMGRDAIDGFSAPTPGLQGQATALAVDPLSSMTAYAAIEGGVFRTVDGGAHWERADAGLIGAGTAGSGVRLAIDPLQSGTLFASISTTDDAGASRSTVFATIDGGSSWEPRNRGLGSGPGLPLNAEALAVHPRDRDVLYASVPGAGIFKTSNGGR